jgi:hypothetical protein
MSRPFEAAYVGTCGNCDGKIRDGQWVQFDTTDQLVHVICPDPTVAVRPMCPDCFTELPATGVCGVCE